MWFVVLGVVFIGMKLGEVGFVAQWAWWWVLAPFALAVVWWAWADSTGLTKKREMDKMEAKKVERRRKNLESLGLYDPSRKSAKKEVDVRQRVAQKIEGKRSRIREENKDVVRHSRFDDKSSSGLESEPPRA
jgi:small Trp-rich protein